MTVSPLESRGPGGMRHEFDSDRILGQIEREEIRCGPEAAREIARRIDEQGGFWGPRIGVWA